MKLKFAPPAGQSNASQIRSRETTELAHGQRLIHIAETNASECAARRSRSRAFAIEKGNPEIAELLSQTGAKTEFPEPMNDV